jgi:hypothetical protein
VDQAPGDIRSEIHAFRRKREQTSLDRGHVRILQQSAESRSPLVVGLHLQLTCRLIAVRPSLRRDPIPEPAGDRPDFTADGSRPKFPTISRAEPVPPSVSDLLPTYCLSTGRDQVALAQSELTRLSRESFVSREMSQRCSSPAKRPATAARNGFLA